MAQPRKTAAVVLTENTGHLIRTRLDDALPCMSLEDRSFLYQVLDLYLTGHTNQRAGLVNAFEGMVTDGGDYVLLRSKVEASAVRAFLEDYRSAPKHLAPKGNGWYVYRNPKAQNESQEA
jgi:hypothetical protein